MCAEPSLEALFAAWNAGERKAVDDIVERLYPLLHQRVKGALRSESNRHTLETTDLLHDLYIKLRGVKPDPDPNLDSFMSLAATAVHSLLVDRARRAMSKKRGARPHLVTLSHAEIPFGGSAESSLLDVVRVHRALERIRERDEHMATHIELRLLFGLTEAELVQVFGSNRTRVQKEWQIAKRRLPQELHMTLTEGETDGEPEGMA